LNFCYRFNVRKSLVALVRRGGGTKDSVTNGYEHTKCSWGSFSILLMVFGLMIMFPQKVAAKVTIKIAPHGMNVIGVVLSVIKLN